MCPNGAIYLVDGRAMVEGDLCTECEACIGACPTGAIAYTSQVVTPPADEVPLPAARPEPEIIRVRTQPVPVPFRARLLPVVGAALAWAGRELVPRLAEFALEGLDRRAVGKRMSRAVRNGPDQGSRGRRGGKGGRRRRYRRRGG